MTLRTGEDTLIWRRKLYIALCGGIVLEEALDLSSDRILNEWRHNMGFYLCGNEYLGSRTWREFLGQLGYHELVKKYGVPLTVRANRSQCAFRLDVSIWMKSSNVDYSRGRARERGSGWSSSNANRNWRGIPQAYNHIASLPRSLYSGTITSSKQTHSLCWHVTT